MKAKAKKRAKLPGPRSKSQAKRFGAQARKVPEMSPEAQRIDAVLVELADARHKLALCRECMEAHDPGNARMIFGPPLHETAPAEAPSGAASSTEASPPEEVVP